MRFAPGVLVFEREPRWAPLIRLQLADQRVLVRPCRTAGDVLPLALRMPGAVVVADLAAGAGAVLHLAERLLLSRARVHLVAVVAAESTGLEWILRELGALAVLDQLEAPARLAGQCLRVLKGQQAGLV